MKTIKISNGTEAMIFLESNCYRCKKYNYENPLDSCSGEIAIGFGNELSDSDFKEFFNNEPVEHNSVCLKFDKVEDGNIIVSDNIEAIKRLLEKKSVEEVKEMVVDSIKINLNEKVEFAQMLIDDEKFSKFCEEFIGLDVKEIEYENFASKS